METYSLLSLFKDLTYFLFSTLQLLLTHILPLVAMLVGSLLLHIFHFISSLLYTRRPGSTKSSMVKQSRALQGRRGRSSDSFAVNDDRDALQEELFDEGDAAYAPQEEYYEDCVDEDESYIEEQQSQMGCKHDQGSSQSGKVDDLLKEVGDISLKGVGDSQQEVGDLLQEVGDNLRTGEGDSIQQEGDSRQEVADHLLEGEGDALQEVVDLDNKVGDSLQAPQITTRISRQPSLFPSDLPPTLDPVVTAAGNPTTAASTSSIKPRTLPPSLSNIEKALQEMSSQPIQKRGTAGASAELEATPNPAVRAASHDKFMDKFNQHFKRNGHG